MYIIEAPQVTYPVHAKLFIAGGISNCPNWQKEAITLLDKVEGIAYNPRRTSKFSEDIAGEQIEWEHSALRNSDTVLFWFPAETLCPITLFELGVFSQRKNTPIFVGTHPDYQRKFDVIKQLELERPEVRVHHSIEDTVNNFMEWDKKNFKLQ